jgi:hypothetical protein
VRYVENTQRNTEPMSPMSSTREKRKTQSEYFVYFQEYEFDIGMVENDPITFKQAIKSSNSQRWIDVLNEEMKSMKNNDV